LKQIEDLKSKYKDKEGDMRIDEMSKDVFQKLEDAIKRGEIDPNDKDAIQKFLANE